MERVIAGSSMNVESIDLLDSDIPTDKFVAVQLANWAVGVQESGLMRRFQKAFNGARWSFGLRPALRLNAGSVGT